MFKIQEMDTKDVQIFNSQFGEVRIVGDNENPMFCLADVCKAIGINNARMVRQRLDEDDVSQTDTIDNLGRTQSVIFVTESGLYDVILRSDSPNAKPFKKWVTSEVLPAIRKSGGYVAARVDDTPELIMARALQVAQQTIDRHAQQLALAETTIKEQAPKVDYYDHVLQSESLIATNVIAKELGTSAVTLNRKLHEMGVIYNSAGTWVLYQKYQHRGYTGTKTHYYYDSNGNERTTVLTYWTEAGKQFIHSILSQKGGAV